MTWGKGSRHIWPRRAGVWPALGQGRLLLPLFLRPFSGGAQNHKASLRKLARLTRGGGLGLELARAPPGGLALCWRHKLAFPHAPSLLSAEKRPPSHLSRPRVSQVELFADRRPSSELSLGGNQVQIWAFRSTESYSLQLSAYFVGSG